MSTAFRPKVRKRGGYWGIFWMLTDGTLLGSSFTYASWEDAYTAADRQVRIDRKASERDKR